MRQVPRLRSGGSLVGRRGTGHSFEQRALAYELIEGLRLRSRANSGGVIGEHDIDPLGGLLGH